MLLLLLYKLLCFHAHFLFYAVGVLSENLAFLRELDFNIAQANLTDILKIPDGGSHFIAATSTAVISLSVSNGCKIVAGVDDSVSASCLISANAQDSFIDITQLEYSEPWEPTSSQYAKLVIIVEYEARAIWKLDLLTDTLTSMHSEFTHHCSPLFPAFLTRQCKYDGRYFVYLENLEESEWEAKILNMATSQLSSTNMNTSGDRNVLHAGDGQCGRDLAVAISKERSFTLFNILVWWEDNLLKLRSRQFITLYDIVFPVKRRDGSVNEVYTDMIHLPMKVSDTQIGAVVQKSNAIAIFGRKETNRHYKFSALGIEKACKSVNIIRSWFYPTSLEGCIYVCMSLGQECGGASFDSLQQACQLHSTVIVSTVLSAHATCVEKETAVG